MESPLHRRHQWLNMIQSWLLVAGSLALFVAAAWAFFGTGGIVYALVFGAVSLYLAGRISPAMVLRFYRAREIGRDRFPTGHAMLDELVARAGLSARPRLYVLPSRMLNAFAVGNRDDSAICLTDALVRSMSTRELAAIMAHEISHIRNEDVRVMAIADMVSRFTSILSTLGILSLVLNLPAALLGYGVAIPWLAILFLVSAPTIGGLLQMALSRTREYDADLGAVLLTGDPHAMASALRKLEAVQRHYWEGMILPGGRYPDPSLLRTHPPTAERIARLMALAAAEKAARPQWGRAEADRYREAAAALNRIPRIPISDGGSGFVTGQVPAGDRPRFHLRGGGLYW